MGWGQWFGGLYLQVTTVNLLDLEERHPGACFILYSTGKQYSFLHLDSQGLRGCGTYVRVSLGDD